MLNNKYFIIDFDSTFVSVEALDELAKISLHDKPNKDEIIEKIIQITTDGMDGSISITNSLIERIQLCNPNKSQITALIQELQHKVSNSVKRNIEFFKQFRDNIYIVSSGFKEYIVPVVKEFGILENHVFANEFRYDMNENIIGLDESNPLCMDRGKVTVVKNLNLFGDIYVIGDGMTDYEITQLGDKIHFYAFTENVSREKVIAQANYIVPNFDEFLYQNNLPMGVSYPKNRIKVLLLENIHETGFNLLYKDGYSVERVKGSLSEDDLCKKIKDVSVLGIRSKTTVSKRVLDCAERLMTIGAFCIGTNQIDLDYATKKGICVFNAPYSNTRSVVELVIGEIIMLFRKTIQQSNKLHNGVWNKSAENSFEIRGKKLGIVGYGNIGSQLSVLAESLGMQVYYYDIVERLHLGNAKKCGSLEELLQIADVVTLHVDGRKENAKLIGAYELSLMKDNAIFINLSRGHVVDIEALITNLRNGKFLGVGIDVFPYEPKDNKE